MARELALPKTSPRDVAFAILDGIEAGQEDILPGPIRGGFWPTVRVLAEGLGTADRRNGRCDASGLRG